jgi:hypothetical protein
MPGAVFHLADIWFKLNSILQDSPKTVKDGGQGGAAADVSPR